MKVLNIGRMGLAAALGFAAFAAGAADVAFIGTDGELSTPTNWTGGSLPGADDVGMVSGMAALTVSAPMTIGGLRLDGLTEAAVVNATAELSVGTSGITSTSTARTTINGTLAVLEGQTWSFVGPLTLNAKISGEDDLTINATFMQIDCAPEYGGKLTTCAPLQYTGKGKIAREFVSNHDGTEWEGAYYDHVRLEGTNTWRSLFTDGNATFSGWVRSFLSAPSSDGTAYPHLILEDGDSLKSYNRVFGFAAGTVEQRSGTIEKNYYLLVGSSEGKSAFDVKYLLKGESSRAPTFSSAKPAAHVERRRTSAASRRAATRR